MTRLQQLARVAVVGLVCVVAAQAVFAQPLPCSRVPAAEREIARRQGVCVDPPPPTEQQIKKPPAVETPKLATACPYQLPKLTVTTYDVWVKALDPRQFRPRRFEVASSRPRGMILRQSTERLEGQLCWANFWVSDGSLVTVPLLTGATREEAARKLQEAQLAITVVEKPSVEPAGRVFEQDPQSNKDVPRGSTVQVTIARPVLVDVPPVIGLPYADALARLQQFTVERGEVASARPRGEVADQNPRPPARRLLRDPVKVLVSDGSLTMVPPVKQLLLEAARRRLHDEERRLGADVTVQEDDAAPDVVLDQDPPAGTEVSRGSTVKLLVSTGLPVPGVTGEPIDEAAKRLVRFTVERTEVESTEPLGRVLDQDPKPPTRGAAGTRVTLRVSDGSLVTVPNVQSQALAAARTALQSVGLAATVMSGPDRDDASVTLQVPSAGALAKRASVVQLQVAPPPVRALWYAAASVAVLATALLAWRILKPKSPPPATAPPVDVVARLDSSVPVVRIEVAAPHVPTVRVEARLMAGATEVRFPEGDRR